MTLTEEQRGALAHAINYIDETDLPVGELDGFDREVLRAMIDSSDPIPDVTELVELLAAGEHEQWAVWAQAILDSEPGLSDRRKAAWPEMIATPYENLSEELKNKDRREVYLRSQAALDYIQQQSTEIDRLRGFETAARDLNNDLTRIAGERDDLAAQIQEMQTELVRVNQLREIEIDQVGAAIVAMAEGAKQHVLKTHTIMKNVFDEADSLAGYCEELENIVITKDARIKALKADLEQSERVVEARLDVIDQQAARIKELEAELEEAQESLTEAYLLGSHKKAQELAPRIKELEATLVEDRAVDIAYDEGHLWSRLLQVDGGQRQEEYRERARSQLQLEGKIGPDAAKPRSWQITKERVRAIRLSEELAWDCKVVDVLRAMLTEAGQE